MAERAEEIARALRAFHDTRPPAGVLLGPRAARGLRRVVRERGGELPRDVRGARRAIAGADQRARCRCGARGPATTICSPGNIIRAREDGRMLIVDWEYAGMGHPCFDLGNLSVNNDFDEAHRGPAAGRLPRRASVASGAGGAETDARALRCARGGLGGRAGERSPTWTSTSRGTGEALRAPARRGAADADFEAWLARGAMVRAA